MLYPQLHNGRDMPTLCNLGAALSMVIDTKIEGITLVFDCTLGVLLPIVGKQDSRYGRIEIFKRATLV